MNVSDMYKTTTISSLIIFFGTINDEVVAMETKLVLSNAFPFNKDY